MNQPITSELLRSMTISAIAATVEDNWPKVNFAARPYLDAMHTLTSIDDNYMLDSGKSIVIYFLGNATTWRGDVARLVKAELNRRIK